MMTQNASCNTILQTIVDTDKRGRVMSFYTMSFMGMAPFGSLLAGALASRVGPAGALLACGGGCLLLGFWLMSQLPILRAAMRPVYIRLGIIPDVTLAEGVEEACEPIVASIDQDALAAAGVELAETGPVDPRTLSAGITKTL